MTADETCKCHHEYNTDPEERLKKKLLAADDCLAFVDFVDTVHSQFRNSTSGGMKLRKISECAVESLTGWCPNPKIILRKEERETKSANVKEVQQFNNYYKLKQAQDKYVFKHYKNIEQYIQQYRHEHTCLGPSQTSSGKEVGDEIRRNMFVQNTVPPQQAQLKNGHSLPSRTINTMNGHCTALQYTCRRDNTVCAFSYNGCSHGSSQSPDYSVQDYRYKLAPCAPVRTDTELSSESEKDAQTVPLPRASSAIPVRQNRGLIPTKVTVPSSPNVACSRVKQGPLQSLTVQAQQVLKTGDAAYSQNGIGHLENIPASSDKQECDSTNQESNAGYNSLLKSTTSCLNTSLQTPHLKYQNASEISVSPTSMKAECVSSTKSEECFNPTAGRESDASRSYHAFPNEYMLDGINSMVNGKFHWNPSLSSLVVRGKHKVINTEHDVTSSDENARSFVKLATTRIDTDYPQEREESFVSNDDRGSEILDNDTNFTYERKVRPATEKPVRMTSSRHRELNKIPNDGSKHARVSSHNEVSGNRFFCRSLRPEQGNGDSLQHLTRPVPIFSFLVSMGKAGRKLRSARQCTDKEKKRPQSEVDVSVQKLASFMLAGYQSNTNTQPKIQKAHIVEKQKKKGPSVASGLYQSVLQPEQDNPWGQNIDKCSNCGDTSQNDIKHRLSFKICRVEQTAEAFESNRNLKKLQKRSNHKLYFLKVLPKKESSEVDNLSRSTLMKLTEKISDKEHKRKGLTRETSHTELYEQRRLEHILEQLKLKMNTKQNPCKEKKSNALPSTLVLLRKTELCRTKKINQLLPRNKKDFIT